MRLAISRRALLSHMSASAASVMGLGVTIPAPADTPANTTVSLGAAPPGSLPSGFVPGLAGGGGPVAWQIVADDSAPSRRVLAQISTDRTSGRYPVCIYDRLTARDIDVSVRFKPVSGRVDQAGGIIVRVIDPNTYYVVRANALENNVRLYHMIEGRRTQFAGADIRVQSGVWQALRLRAEGSRFEAYFEGKRLFEASDSRLPGPGRIGLWTKADSVTHFDQLAYAILRK